MRVSKDTLAEVKAHLKRQWAEQAKELEFNRVDREMRRGNDEVPMKRTGKKGKITKGTSQSYGANVLNVSPGAAKSHFASFLKMIDAEETGCKLATQAQKGRLQRSAKNANTNHGNYNATELRKKV